MSGRCMITRVKDHVCWRNDDETKRQESEPIEVLHRGRTVTAPRRQSRAQDGAHARNSYLRLEGRQSRRRETVINSGFGIVRDLFNVVPQLIEELKNRKGA